MGSLRLGSIPDDRPVKRTVLLSAALDRDLKTYADLLAMETGQTAVAVEKIIPAMLERFIHTDREFLKARRTKRFVDKSKREASLS